MIPPHGLAFVSFFVFLYGLAFVSVLVFVLVRSRQGWTMAQNLLLLSDCFLFVFVFMAQK